MMDNSKQGSMPELSNKTGMGGMGDQAMSPMSGMQGMMNLGLLEESLHNAD